MRQKLEIIHQFSERVRELQAQIQQSLNCSIAANREVHPNSPDSITANLSSIDTLALQSFMGGLKPTIQEIVAWKDPATFEAILTLAQRKELKLSNIMQPPLTIAAVTLMVTNLI